MASDAIDSLFGSLTLTHTEAQRGVVTTSGAGDVRQRSLIGRSLLRRDEDVRGAREALEKIWGCKFNAVKLSKNTFQFIFEKIEDRNRVFDDGPWCYKNFLLILKPWHDQWRQLDGYFDRESFWVHGTNLEMHQCQPLVGRRIAAMIGAEKCQLCEETVTGMWFFRLRVSVDLLQPLRRFVQLIIDGVPMTVNLQYERLPHMCFLCGLMDHTQNSCTKVECQSLIRLEREKLPYGPRLGITRSRTPRFLEDVELRESGMYGEYDVQPMTRDEREGLEGVGLLALVPYSKGGPSMVPTTAMETDAITTLAIQNTMVIEHYDGDGRTFRVVPGFKLPHQEESFGSNGGSNQLGFSTFKRLARKQAGPHPIEPLPHTGEKRKFNDDPGEEASAKKGPGSCFLAEPAVVQ